jgi:hypothetical protein
MSPHSCHMPHTPHLLQLDKPIYIWRRVQTTQLPFRQFHLPSLTSLLFGPNIFLSTLFSNILNLCSYLNIKDNIFSTI